MDQWLTAETMRIFATQVFAVAMVAQVLRGMTGSLLASDGRTQVVSLVLGIAVQMAFSVPDYGAQSVLLGVLNGVGVALAAMKGTEFGKPAIKALVGK